MKCPEHGYTLRDQCPRCGRATRKPGPAKYSPEDRYGAYRRKLKRLEQETGEESSSSPPQPSSQPHQGS